MSLEVVMQLPRCNKDYIKQLMHFQVSCFSIMEDLADVVHWALDAMNPPGGGSNAFTSMGSGPRNSWPPRSERASGS
jgi:hypothetical protein